MSKTKRKPSKYDRIHRQKHTPFVAIRRAPFNHELLSLIPPASRCVGGCKSCKMLNNIDFFQKINGFHKTIMLSTY